MFTFQKNQALITILILLNSIYMGEAVPAFADNNESEDYQYICADHPPVSNTKTSNSSKWNWEGHTSKERHFHVGNKIARQKIASVMHGRDVDDANEDYSKLCAALITEYKEGHVESIVYGFGNEKGMLLGVVNPDKKGAIDIKFINKATQYTIETTAYLQYHDNVVATTWCFSDGKVGWTIWSTDDILKPEEKKMSLEHLEKIGFNIKDEVPFYEGSCPNKFNNA